MNTENLKALKKYPKVIVKLRKVREFIRKHPKHLDMNDWIQPQGNGPWGAESCGTTACIAGWYSVLDGAKVEKCRGLCGVNSITVKNKRFACAGSYLTKTYPDIDWPVLFFTYSWPDEFRDAYDISHNVYDYRQTANITAKRITHFLRTGE